MVNTKLVIYTALFGDYDDLLEPKEKFEIKIISNLIFGI